MSQKVLVKERHILEQDTLLYWPRQGNVEKNVCLFFLLECLGPFSPPWEPQTPFFTSGTLDFSSTWLGIDSLTGRFFTDLKPQYTLAVTHQQATWHIHRQHNSPKARPVGSVTQSCLTLCNPVNCSTPGLSVLHHLLELLKFMSIKVVMPSNHLILCHPLLLPSIFPSIRVFSNKPALRIRWPKYWSFSLSHQSRQWVFVADFLQDWLIRYLLAVQGTLRSLFQHHNSKAYSLIMLRIN